MVNLILKRIAETRSSTAGVFSHNGRVISLTIEAGFRMDKNHVLTRIPEGRYRCEKATDTKYNELYRIKYGHKWVMRILDVSEFGDVDIHIGNYARETLLAPLLNSSISYEHLINEWVGTGSAIAYKWFYKYIDALSDDDIWIEIL